MITIAKKKNTGKSFETDIQNSCKKQGVFFFRVRDVNLPPDVRRRVKLPKNKYDSLIYYNGYLLPMELKSTDKKSISLDEKVIKQHQIDNLYADSKFEGVLPGFIFNFRNEDNRTYFVDIHSFINYKHIAENQLKHTYKSKVNRASIPIDICREIGTEVLSIKKRVNHQYFVKQLVDELVVKEKK